MYEIGGTLFVTSVESDLALQEPRMSEMSELDSLCRLYAITRCGIGPAERIHRQLVLAVQLSRLPSRVMN